MWDMSNVNNVVSSCSHPFSPPVHVWMQQAVHETELHLRVQLLLSCQFCVYVCLVNKLFWWQLSRWRLAPDNSTYKSTQSQCGSTQWGWEQNRQHRIYTTQSNTQTFPCIRCWYVHPLESCTTKTCKWTHGEDHDIIGILNVLSIATWICQLLWGPHGSLPTVPTTPVTNQIHLSFSSLNVIMYILQQSPGRLQIMCECKN